MSAPRSLLPSENAATYAILLQGVRYRTGYKQRIVEEICNALLDEIMDHLENGIPVMIDGLGLWDFGTLPGEYLDNDFGEFINIPERAALQFFVDPMANRAVAMNVDPYKYKLMKRYGR